MSTDQLRQKFQKLVADKSLKVSIVARGTGYSPAAISQWLSGSYKADTSRLHASLESFLHRFESGDLGFIETETALKVWDACETAMEEGEIALVIGRPGSGKSEAAKEKVKQYDRPRKRTQLQVLTESPSPIRRIVYEEVPHKTTARMLLEKLCELLNCSRNGSRNHLIDRIVEKVKREPTLVIIDEADHLDVNALETVRNIYDKTQVGMVLIGTRKLELVVSSLEQLLSRVGYRVHVDGFDNEDLHRILRKTFGDDVREDVIAEIGRACEGSMRRLSKIVARIQKIVDMTRVPLAPAVVRRAADQTLIGSTREGRPLEVVRNPEGE